MNHMDANTQFLCVSAQAHGTHCIKSIARAMNHKTLACLPSSKVNSPFHSKIHFTTLHPRLTIVLEEFLTLMHFPLCPELPQVRLPWWFQVAPRKAIPIKICKVKMPLDFFCTHCARSFRRF